MIKKLLTIVLFSCAFSATYSHGIKKRAYPFHDGETMEFIVYYNWGPLWLKAGKALLTTTLTTYNGKKAYHFEAIGNSYKTWDWLFKLEDYYQVYTCPRDLQPLFYEKNTLEGGYRIHNLYYFNPDQKELRMVTEESRKPKKDTTVRLRKKIYDAITATYFLRTFDMDTIAKNDTIAVPVVLDGKLYVQRIIYSGKAVLKNKDTFLSAFVFTAVLSESKFFSGDDAVKVYVSDDEHRYPLYVKADIVVGSIKIFLKPYMDIKVVSSPKN